MSAVSQGKLLVIHSAECQTPIAIDAVPAQIGDVERFSGH